jgi:hypothetical protein
MAHGGGCGVLGVTVASNQEFLGELGAENE